MLDNCLKYFLLIVLRFLPGGQHPARLGESRTDGNSVDLSLHANLFSKKGKKTKKHH